MLAISTENTGQKTLLMMLPPQNRANLLFLLSLAALLSAADCEESVDYFNPEQRRVQTYESEKLLNRLFVEKKYNREIRPVLNVSSPIFISLGITLMQLLFVDERSQVMKTNVWIQTAWTDHQLTWDPLEFGGITALRVKSKDVWRPGIVLMNNADGKYEPSYDPNVVVYYYGTLVYIPPAIYKSSCEINVEFFPFDEQRCQLKLASWTYSSEEIQYGWYERRDKAVMQDYMVSGTWDVVSCPGRIENASLHGARPISMVVFTLTIRRKTLFFTVNLIIPCIMLALLCNCVFFLPSDAGEKITLSLSLLFSINVFLLLVFKMLPATGKQVPLISKYLIFTSAMNITSILSTVINNNINYRTPLTHCMPNWIRNLFVLQLPRFLFMKSPLRIIDENQEPYLYRLGVLTSGSKDGYLVSSMGVLRSPRCTLSSPAHLPTAVNCKRTQTATSEVRSRFRNQSLTQTQCCQNQNQSQKSLQNCHVNGDVRCQCSPKDSTIASVVENVIYMAEYRRLVEENKQVRCEWKFIAAVIDRILLIAYAIVTSVVTVVTFATAPSQHEFNDAEMMRAS